MENLWDNILSTLCPDKQNMSAKAFGFQFSLVVGLETACEIIHWRCI